MAAPYTSFGLALRGRIASAMCAFTAALLLPTGSFAVAKTQDVGQLSILADPSLTIPLSQIAREYSREHLVAVTTSFATAKEQADLITSGVEADLFITTQEKLLQELKYQGLVDVYSQKSIARNRLVIATIADNPLELILIRHLPITSILSKDSPHFVFALGDPEFQQAGLSGLEALRSFELDNELEPYFVFLQSPVDLHRTVANDHSYGIMLQSEVLRNPDIKKLDVFPEATHKPILYQSVVVAGEHMEEARRFTEFLTSTKALAMFKSYGFEAP